MRISDWSSDVCSSDPAYMLEKRISRNPEKFGHGAVEGVAAPESANNAAAQTAFIPTLTLGIPGSATMALFLGALMIHRSEEHTSELQSLMRISYAVFCLKKKKKNSTPPRICTPTVLDTTSHNS